MQLYITKFLKIVNDGWLLFPYILIIIYMKGMKDMIDVKGVKYMIGGCS